LVVAELSSLASIRSRAAGSGNPNRPSCGQKPGRSPRSGPDIRALVEEKCSPAVLDLLRSTDVGRTAPEDEDEFQDGVSESSED